MSTLGGYRGAGGGYILIVYFLPTLTLAANVGLCDAVLSE